MKATTVTAVLTLVQVVCAEMYLDNVDTFDDVSVHLDSQTCICSFFFEIENDEVSQERSEASCNSDCSGNSMKEIVLTNYNNGDTFTFHMSVTNGEASMSSIVYQRQITPGDAKEGFFEGDIKLNAEQIKLLKESEIIDSEPDDDATIEPSGNLEPSGNAIIGTDYRWPSKTVRFQLHGYLDNNEKNLVRTTLRNLQSRLDNCIRFVETNSGNRIVVKNNLGGCYSMVGYQGQPTQDLSLQRGGCMHKGVIEHEFLHAIGLYHHQSRSDRDSYVKIIWNNIPTDKRHNFKKYSSKIINHYNLPYDYRSLMHYGGKDFGGGRMTIQTLDSRYQNVIGQRQGISDTDVAMVKKMYGCGSNPVVTTVRPVTTVKPYVCNEDKYDICPDFKASGHCTSGNAKVDAWMEENCYKSCKGCLEGFGGPDDWKFCKSQVCNEGQGDCDSDDECAGSLVCGEDNCRKYNPLAEKTADCCTKAGGGGGCPYTDNNQDCPGWAKAGYCDKGSDYAEYMEKNCAKSCKCSEYNCQEVGVNYQNRVRATVFQNVSSWEDCQKKCAQKSKCSAWVWNNSGAGVYKYRCAVMEGYGKRAADVNTVAGPKICP